jgi:phosphoglycerate kinase
MNGMNNNNKSNAAQAGKAIDFSKIKTLDRADVRGKRVLLRVDFNVPMQDGVVGDTTRMERVLPTIRKLLDAGAAVIVLSHWGRPKGQPSPETSLEPVAAKLREMLGGTKVHFVKDCVGMEAKRAVDALKPGEVAVLENLRHHRGEESNDPEFAKRLADLGDIYVDDAFSSAHRTHASIDAITNYLPSYAGLLMMAEIRALEQALEHPARPVMAIVGGAKTSTKIKVLINLAARMDSIVLAGGLAGTMLYAKGVEIGISLCEKDAVPIVKEIMAAAEKSGCEIILPTDVVVAKEFKAGAESCVCDVDDIPPDAMILDTGPKSVEALKRRLAETRTVLWNGPLGAFEIAPFGEGTFELAREAARLTKSGKLVTIAGGGDTVSALNAAGAAKDFTYVSTAGGAFLEWLEGATLPAVVALTRDDALAMSEA